MSSKGPGAETDPTVIAQNIEHTRQDVTETLDAIQQRLEPEQVTDYVKDVAHYVILEVKDAVRDLAGQATGAIREARSKKQDEAAPSSRASTPNGLQTRTDDQAKQITGRVAGQMQEKAGAMQQQSQDVWQRVKSNPIALGALGVAIGGLAAAIVPATATENQLMGETRDRMLGSAQEVAGQTIDNVKSVAAEAGNVVMEEAKSQGIVGQGGSKSEETA